MSTHSTRTPGTALRRGWTTGACATAALRAALHDLWEERRLARVEIVLPRGERPVFEIAQSARGAGWAQAGVIKDAGDDPDVTHGALVLVRVSASAGGVVFAAGEGVGTVTMPGLPIAPGEPAINPVPRRMMCAEIDAIAAETGHAPDVRVEISVPGGAEIAARTWNPRLGIVGGLSILGTTGIVRPFSCAAWIASIHRGIDVARAAKLPHVAGATGAQSERAVQALYALPDHAMIDMGDFAGGMSKYLLRHPVPRVTIAGGLAKLAKLGQGARDLHSSRSQVDFERLAASCGMPQVAGARTVLEAHGIAGPSLAQAVARDALRAAGCLFEGSGIAVDIVACDREGRIVARA
ncbi:cobalt-precorrin-5B (C(1))-methyltransferase [Profundibacterium mesophilum]|uniref:Cobalt-precorrin-5B C(1)-methyltransferase n=1 Tax=Profundibacterium mesophilum KAUST100406-0324 TaxID=1037889 RepID=A0A921P1J7_9RHOB|nr:cobalt-precorrin-5B (C(1))-methyltransferase [Profundibacterium mesophilum]KAF0677513.1 putative cobalt-precorrin-6A synthase deacetylating [Profundibacterium mesophilum KAUST100406-0324]